MNAKRCLSFQTQDKGHDGPRISRKLKRSSMDVTFVRISCPYNKGLDNPLATEIDPDLLIQS